MKQLACKPCHALLISLTLMFFIIPGTHAEEDANVSFRWAFGALVGPQQDRTVKTITGDTSLKSGDQLKFCVELQKRCFVYLIYHSGQGDLEMLFPYTLEQLTTNYEALRNYCIPRGDAWFELDEKGGFETFYLLASATRLNDLEQFFQKPGPMGSLTNIKESNRFSPGSAH